MKVENIPINEIKPYERNAKKHDETQIKNVMESIKQFGIVQWWLTRTMCSSLAIVA